MMVLPPGLEVSNINSGGSPTNNFLGSSHKDRKTQHEDN
jgi:hypothetical protein